MGALFFPVRSWKAVWPRETSRMALEAIRYDGKSLAILNQLLLPLQSVYERLQTVEDAWSAIRSMKVASLIYAESDHLTLTHALTWK